MTDKPAFHWVPNALTIGRIFAIPALFYFICAAPMSTPEGVGLAKWALALFLACAITDFLDGFIARKLEVTSDFGRMLDPISDKLLVAGSLVAINLAAAQVHGVLWPVLVPSLIIIGRDIFVSGIREHAALKQIVMPPTQLAKWKTAFEMLAIILFLAAMAGMSGHAPTGETGRPPLLAMIAGACLWLAAILSAYTGFHYFRAGLKQ